MLRIVDRTMFRKHLDEFTYPYAIKGKVLYYFKERPENVCLINITRRENTDGLFITSYFPEEKQAQTLKESDEDIIKAFLDNNFIDEKLILFDFVNSKVVYDLTANKEVSSTYASFDPEVNRELLGVSLTFKAAGGVDRKLFVANFSNSVIKSLAHFAYTTQGLLEPTGDATNFGTSLAFYLGNSLDGFPTTLETYTKLDEFDISFRRKTIINDPNKERLTKLTDSVYKTIAENKIKKLNTEKEEEVEDDNIYILLDNYMEPVDNKITPVKNFLLSEIIKNKQVNFAVIGRYVDIDVHQDKLSDIINIFALRGKLTFYIDNTKIFDGVNLGKRLGEITELIGIKEGVGISYYVSEDE